MFKKIYFIVLAIIVLLVLVSVGYSLINKKGQSKTIADLPKVNVTDLKDATEIALGTIVYPGAEKIANSDIYKSTDSLDGVITNYGVDLTNRYKAEVFKKEIVKADALNKKAYVLSLANNAAKVKVTVWAGLDGWTYFTISK